MPNITVEFFEGRTVEQKRELADRIATTVSEVLKVKKEIVRIKFVDLKKHDMSIGGVLVSDQK